MLHKLDRIDRKWSRNIHESDTHYLELPLLVAGMVFAPFIVPFIVATIFLTSILYFRSDEDITDGGKLFSKSFGYTMIYLLWVLLGLLTTVAMKKFIYRERP